MRLLAGFAVGGADGADQAMASTTHSNAIDVAVAGNGHDSDARIGTLHIGRGGRPSECGVVEGASEPRAGVGKEIEITELAKGDGRGQNPSSSLTAPLRRPAVTASSWPGMKSGGESSPSVRGTGSSGGNRRPGTIHWVPIEAVLGPGKGGSEGWVLR